MDPERYDYRRAALDALHFPKLVDRFWQNLRRCAGYQVQYFATIEPQRRLAPTCTRRSGGRSPARSCARCGPPPTTNSGGRPTTRPSTPTGSGLDRPGYTDPTTGELLPTWDQALDALERPRGRSRRTWCASGNRTTSRA